MKYKTKFWKIGLCKGRIDLAHFPVTVRGWGPCHYYFVRLAQGAVGRPTIWLDMGSPETAQRKNCTPNWNFAYFAWYLKWTSYLSKKLLCQFNFRIHNISLVITIYAKYCSEDNSLPKFKWHCWICKVVSRVFKK